MGSKKIRKNGFIGLIIAAIAGIILLSAAALGGYYLTQQKRNLPSKSPKVVNSEINKFCSSFETLIDSSIADYCTDPTSYNDLLSLANKQNNQDLVSLLKTKLAAIQCINSQKRIISKAPSPVPKKVINFDYSNAYNSHYYCESDNTNQCEMCWKNDTSEICCYKTIEQIDAGNDKCGSNDRQFSLQ